MVDATALRAWGRAWPSRSEDAGRSPCWRQGRARGRRDATATRVIQVCMVVGSTISLCRERLLPQSAGEDQRRRGDAERGGDHRTGGAVAEQLAESVGAAADSGGRRQGEDPGGHDVPGDAPANGGDLLAG